MSIPENHVTAEGRTLRAAIEAAAAQLGVSPTLVEHKIDLAHFKSAGGGVSGADTVKIFAWSKDPADLAALVAAEDWMKGVLGAMERTGTVRGEQKGGHVTLHVDAGEGARHLVGRGGATLRAIQHLMGVSLSEKFPDVSFRIDVARADGDRDERRDFRPREGGGDRDYRPREGGGDRDFRGGDRGPRRDDPGPRRDDRGPRRDRGGSDDRPRRSDADVEDLKRLARKIAERVLETGEPETIRRELNSFDRRIVHVEVAEIKGVASRSVGEGHDRRIEVVPASMAEASESREESRED